MSLPNETKPSAVREGCTRQESLLGLEGHRKRLRARFLRDCGESMHDYELLELLLIFAVPRRDVKPLSKSLLRQFSTFADVISAESASLKSVEGLAESSLTILKLVFVSAQRLLQQQVNSDVITSWQQIVDLCRARSARSRVEEFRILYLNHKNRLIKDEVLQRGTVDTTTVYPREIIRRLLNCEASSFVISHNHPSGDTTPSLEDIELTKTLNRIAKSLNITLHDHIIVTREGYTSFKSRGLL